jgi:hypothetical protein
LPTSAVAQVTTATISGVATDESKGVLPGVTITATDLAMLVKGVTTNDVTNDPTGQNDAFQLNLDGQQVREPDPPQTAISPAGTGRPRPGAP